MLWLLSKLMDRLNRPIDYTAELEQLRRKQGVYDNEESDANDEQPSPRVVARESIASAVKLATKAYWDVCALEEKAIRPSTLGAPAGLLDEAYDLALEVDLLMSDQGLTWAEAKKRV